LDQLFHCQAQGSLSTNGSLPHSTDQGKDNLLNRAVDKVKREEIKRRKEKGGDRTFIN
jgi:hypothetical protein